MKLNIKRAGLFIYRWINSLLFIIVTMASFGKAKAADVWKSQENKFEGHRVLVICNNAKLPSDKVTTEFEARNLIIMRNAYKLSPKHPINKRSHRPQIEELHRYPYCGEQNEFILIGKDASIKKRWKDTFSVEDLFQTIDAMPMRQFEMRMLDEK